MARQLLLAVVVTLCALVPLVRSAKLYHLDGSLSATASRPTTPNTWAVTAVAPTTAPHAVTIALHFENLDYIQQLFQDIHNPQHPQWLNHLTRQQIHDIIAPPQRSTDRLLQWMRVESGVPAEHVEWLVGANAVRVNSTVGHINRLFNTTMHEYTHTDGYTAYRQLGASYVPDEFVSLIHIVDGLAMMPYALKKHGRVLEIDSVLAKSKKQSATDGSGGSADEHRHGPSATSESGSGSGGEASVGQATGCGFLPLFPVNSMYGWYNVSDQSTGSVGANPTTSTQTVQFYTSDSNNNLEANSFSPSDLKSYSQMWSQSTSGTALKVQTVTGPNDPSNPTGEPSLDVQSITALNPVAANQFELTANGGQEYWWAAGFVSRINISQVVSISYGIDESVFLLPTYANARQDGIPYYQYMAATNNLFMLIGARGTTILASSGDDGAQGIGNANAINGTRCNYAYNPYGDPYGPRGPSVEFPAISPYVTAVGGTEISAACSAFPEQLSGTKSPICSSMSLSKLPQYGVKPFSRSAKINCFDPKQPATESAVSSGGSGYTSGGGFSRYFVRSSWAPWQDSVVSAYLYSGATTPSAVYFNRSGRAIPDVAMYGGAFPIVNGGGFDLAVGTSLSSPLFAAVISILNQQTLQAKGATIGYANPLLYAMAANSPSTFTDITGGNNRCPAGTAAQCPSACQGYSAARGWDPVTGLGVPNVGVMQATLTQYLIYAQGRQTGSVTGITGSDGSGASSTQRLSAVLSLLLIVATTLSVLVL